MQSPSVRVSVSVDFGVGWGGGFRQLDLATQHVGQKHQRSRALRSLALSALKTKHLTTFKGIFAQAQNTF